MEEVEEEEEGEEEEEVKNEKRGGVSECSDVHVHKKDCLETRRLWVRIPPEQPFFYENRKDGSGLVSLPCL